MLCLSRIDEILSQHIGRQPADLCSKHVVNMINRGQHLTVLQFDVEGVTTSMSSEFENELDGNKAQVARKT